MTRFSSVVVVCFLGLTIVPKISASSSSSIHGDYMESRSADVYTGFCVANSEVGLVGDQAILAWKVRGKLEWYLTGWIECCCRCQSQVDPGRSLPQPLSSQSDSDS